MKILHINQSDLSRGAARAAYRIRQSLVHHGAALEIQSQMRVLQKLSKQVSTNRIHFLWKQLSHL